MDWVGWAGVCTFIASLAYFCCRYLVVKSLEINHPELWARLGSPRAIERMRPSLFFSYVAMGKYKGNKSIRGSEAIQFFMLRASIFIAVVGLIAFLVGAIWPKWPV